MIDWDSHEFQPVVHLPDEYEVRDFTSGDDSPSKYEYDIGRYDELRPGMYSADLFAGSRIEVVRRLVQQQQVGFGEQQRRQRHAHAPAA